MQRIQAYYRIESDAADVERKAQAIAVEQSVEMPLAPIDDAYVLENVIASVGEIVALNHGQFKARIDYGVDTVGDDVGQLFNVLFGNCSMLPGVEILDVELPPALLARLRGPRHGINGIRKLLGVERRAITATALKPQGSTTDKLLQLCQAMAEGGIDIIKDDHGIVDQYPHCRFAERVPALQRCVREVSARTGHKVIYAPNLSGDLLNMLKQLELCRDEGVEMVMAPPMLMGPANFNALVEQCDVPILAHPTFAGARRIAPELLFGKLLRLVGADGIIFTNYGGRFSYSLAQCTALAAASRAPWGNIAPAMPVPAGGMTVERVPELLATYGADTMLLIGGSLLEAGPRLRDRTQSFVDSVAACSAGG
ncbi:MAG: ribulose 1,5-bisphosphate carboxylase [Gammaproteobacteria bacterium]|nr:ribulose 1,5-bisphosphate carboxylase [Gammaproteobacteria bacterium]